MKKLAAFLSLAGILAGTALIALLYRASTDWEQINLFLQSFWAFLAVGGGVFLLTTLVVTMSVLFAPAPKPPGPDPETLAELKKAQDRIAALQGEIEDGEKQQLGFQAQAARAQAEVTDLNGRVAHLNHELENLRVREAARPDPGVAEARIKTLNDQILTLNDRIERFQEREAAMGDAEFAKLQIRDLTEQVTQLSKENESLKDRNLALTESERAQMEARDLARQYPLLKQELDASRERQVVLSNDLARTLERTNELNGELIQATDARKALKAERDELQRRLDELAAAPAAGAPGAVTPAAKVAPDAAFQILFLLQKEGRLLDFLNEDLSGIDDETLGGAVRPIHESLRQILADRLVVQPVLTAPEGEEMKLEDPVDPDRIKLTGSVPPKGPYRGVLIHRGWKLAQCKLPELVSGWSGDVIVPAELEIS